MHDAVGIKCTAASLEPQLSLSVQSCWGPKHPKETRVLPGNFPGSVKTEHGSYWKLGALHVASSQILTLARFHDKMIELQVKESETYNNCAINHRSH